VYQGKCYASHDDNASHGALLQLSTEPWQRYVKHIHTGGKHLLSLINDILDLSKIEAGRLQLTVENVQVSATFAEVADTMRPLADKKSQKLSQQAPSGLSLRADATRFKQILMNLIGNAIKFTPEGGDIKLSAHRLNDVVRVEVRDSGPGIPAEEQQRIFDAFYRIGETDKKTEGTGLGLAITQRLVELHGGKLGLESEPGSGSCFYFTLEGAEAIKTREVPTIPEAKQAREFARLLVIEDDHPAALLLQSYLTSAGYDVVLCEQPERALEMAAQLQPSAVTLDLIMKPVNGWKLLSAFKSDQRTAGIPVILVTIVDQVAAGASLGADEYIVKPVKKTTLLAAVERCLNRHSAAGRTRPILVVEDDAPTREFVAELLSKSGYPVITAADGAEARSLVAASLPELVILDLILPDVSGFQLLAEWRTNSRTADLPVFVLTSKDLTSEEQEHIRNHTGLLLQKQHPWQENLIAQLRRTLTGVFSEKQ
jgi:DNA-binding response OmpR family regulator/anti-sigma regulatory factor (Ser/Thr protein kinase)